MSKKVLIVVDMQNDFVTGVLGTPEAVAIVPSVQKRLADAILADDIILFTMDTHETDYLTTQEGKFLPVEHCIRGRHGWELIPEIKNILVPYVTGTDKYFDSDKCFIKGAFGSTDLGNSLRRMNVTEVELIGVCTDICVISNALLIKAFNPEAKITVRASCCAGVSIERHKNALEAMKSCQITVIE